MIKLVTTYTAFVFFSLLVMILPTSTSLRMSLPNLLLISHLFMFFRYPSYIGILWAFIAGIIFDVYTNVPIGVYALIFSATNYLLFLFYHSFSSYSTFTQSLVIAFLEFMVLVFSEILTGHMFKNMTYEPLLHIILTMALWSFLMTFFAKEK